MAPLIRYLTHVPSEIDPGSLPVEWAEVQRQSLAGEGEVAVSEYRGSASAQDFIVLRKISQSIWQNLRSGMTPSEAVEPILRQPDMPKLVREAILDWLGRADACMNDLDSAFCRSGPLVPISWLHRYRHEPDVNIFMRDWNQGWMGELFGQIDLEQARNKMSVRSFWPTRPVAVYVNGQYRGSLQIREFRSYNDQLAGYTETGRIYFRSNDEEQSILDWKSWGAESCLQWEVDPWIRQKFLGSDVLTCTKL